LAIESGLTDFSMAWPSRISLAVGVLVFSLDAAGW
jgi:hypothetical protein